VTETKKSIIIYIIILSVSAVLAHSYFYEAINPDLWIYYQLFENLSKNIDFRHELPLMHERILDGTARFAPRLYRVLVPYICEAISKVLYNISPLFRVNNMDFYASYAILYFLSISFFMAVLFLFLRIWFSSEQALIGVLFVGGTMPIAFRDHVYAAYSLLEMGFFAASLIAIYKKRYWLLAFLIAIASFNRETAVFIPLTFFFANLDSIRFSEMKSWIKSKPILLSCGFFLIWAAVFFGLRFVRGWAPHVGSMEQELRAVFTKLGLLYTFKNVTLFLGGFWIFAILGFKHSPSFIKRVSLIIPFYIVTVCLWAPWWEVRLLMTLYPILVALGLSFIYQPQSLMSPEIG
jgi:hypothetical protein